MESKLSKEERRKDILRSSLPLFAVKGLQVTTKELAAAAGVSEALLYKHFATKEELFESLKVFCCEAVDRDAHELVQEQPSLKLLTEGFFFTNVAILFDHPEAPFTTKETSALVARSLLSKGDFAKEMYDHFGKYIPYMCESLNVAIKNGHAESVTSNQESLFWVYHNMVTGVAFSFLSETEIINYKIKKELLAVEIVFYGLRMCGVKEESISSICRPLIEKLVDKYFKDNV